MKRWRQLRFETRLSLLALGAGAPAVLATLGWLVAAPPSLKVTATVAVAVLTAWLGGAWLVREAVVGPLHTLANLLLALREGDYALRARIHHDDDALGAALREVNLLGDQLRALNVGALEAAALLGKVLEEVDVAIFAFDGESGRLALANRAAVELALPSRWPAARGQTAAALGLDVLVGGEAPRVVQLGPAAGSFELSRTRFRLEGRAHDLVVLTDVQRALRDEERTAWQRLVRVLGHEINNSLAPIQSIAGSLRTLAERPADERPDDFESDLRGGLEIVSRRAESLGRFLRGYSRLLRLPAPRLLPVDVGAWVAQVAQLDERLPVVVTPGPATTVRGDVDQLDQLLINLVKNAVEATLPETTPVEIGWERRGAQLEVRVRDRGRGLAATANLFVPFFTTKPEGTGIGLALSRQIAEAHGGSLQLVARDDARGCEALLRLPLP